MIFFRDTDGSMIKVMILVLGAISLAIGFLASFQLYRRYEEREEASAKPTQKWVLGVCADIAKLMRVPVSVVRIIVLSYSFLLLGILFYFTYYWVMRRRLRNSLRRRDTPEKDPIRITKIDSIHYR